MELYVGNLPDNYTEEELKDTFSKIGTVKSVKIILDPITHESKKFGFVEMENSEDGQKAINSLDGETIYNKVIFVNKAHPDNVKQKKIK